MHDATTSPSAYRFQPHWEVLPAGSHLWRMHSSRFAAEQFKPFDARDRAPGRFHGTPEDPYPCLYAATDPETALAETLLRSIDFDKETSMRLVPWPWVRGKSLHVVRTRCELRLVSLRSGAALAAVCQDTFLLEREGPEHYARTRTWAREIRAQAPEAVGMIWESRRNPSQQALVLFGLISALIVVLSPVLVGEALRGHWELLALLVVGMLVVSGWAIFATAQPDLVGLQEVELIRTGPVDAAPATDLHAGHAAVPTLDHLPGPEGERQRRAAVPRSWSAGRPRAAAYPA